ncbi:hypothetical protein D3C87_465800 [compost metagenome]
MTPLEQGREFARQNLSQCAKEVLEWRRSGAYQGGALSSLAEILTPIDPDNAIRMAEEIVIGIALVNAAK